MQTTSLTNPVVRSYWNSLSSLRPNMKVELIHLLASSLTAPKRVAASTHWADKYAGAWDDDKDADLLAEEIRASRTQGLRELVSFD